MQELETRRTYVALDKAREQHFLLTRFMAWQADARERVAQAEDACMAAFCEVDMSHWEHDGKARRLLEDKLAAVHTSWSYDCDAVFGDADSAWIVEADYHVRESSSGGASVPGRRPPMGTPHIVDAVVQTRLLDTVPHLGCVWLLTTCATFSLADKL